MTSDMYTEPRARYMYIRLILGISFGLIFGITPGTAQTCSCAGAPLLSSQSTGASSAGNLIFGLTYEYHDISSLYSGTGRLQDGTVTRNTQSVLMEVNYGITDRLSLSGTFSYVNKVRTTGLHTPSGGSTVNTDGLGDGILLFRYTAYQQSLWNRYHLALGAGGKLPLGTTSLRRNGFMMNADMQPGTGAWDGVVWSYAAMSFLPHTTLNLFLMNTYRHTGSNDRFAEGDSYRFGNELVTDLGVTNELTSNLTYLMVLRYRSTGSDRLNGSALPNTGGMWLSVVPNLSYAVSERVSLRVSGRLPVFQRLNGTQPTTSFAVLTSLFLSLNSKDDGFDYGPPR